MAYRWDDYYNEAVKVYEKENGSKDPLLSLYDLTIKVCDPAAPKQSDVLELNSSYLGLVEELAGSVDRSFHRPDAHEPSGMAQALTDVFEHENVLAEIANQLAPQLEEKVFRSNIYVDKVTIYRNHETNEPLRSSWLWHFDNNPKEQIKILIYLTDVQNGAAQMEFIMDPDTKDGIKVPTTRAAWDEWVNPWDRPDPSNFYLPEFDLTWRGTDRVPIFVIDTYLANGYKLAKILGKRGKTILFDNNIIHRATPGRTGTRDVAVFQFKPTLEKVSSYINPVNTGDGHRHTTFNVDPAVVNRVVANEDNNVDNQLARILRGHDSVVL